MSPVASTGDSLLARRAAVWGLVALVILSYGRICSNQFTWWDDNLTIHRNPRFDPPTTRDFLYYLTHREQGMYVPLAYTAWGLTGLVAWSPKMDAFGSAIRPAPYHFVSLAVHIATSLLVFAILFRLFGKRWGAFAGAALFAMHPVQVETVAWATSLKEGLCGCFGMVAIWYYLVAVDERPDQPPLTALARRMRLIACSIALVLAQLSNPIAIVIPFFCFVLDIWLIGRPIRKAAKNLAILLMVASVDAIVSRIAQPGWGAPAVPFWARPLIAGDTLAFYIGKLFFPLHLCTEYARRPDLAIARGWVFWTWILPAALGLAIYRLGKTRHWLWAAGVLFAAGAAPVLGFFRFDLQQYSTPADRYLYLSLLGPAIAVAAFFSIPRPRWTRTAWLVVIAILSVKTCIQCGIWHDDITLWTYTTAVSPMTFVGQSNLGAAYERATLIDTGAARDDDVQQAIAHYQRAIEIRPQFLKARENLAAALLRVNRVDDAIADIMELVKFEDEQPIQSANSRAVSRKSLADLLLSRHRPREAVKYLEQAEKLDPKVPDLERTLAEARKLATRRPAAGPP